MAYLLIKVGLNNGLILIKSIFKTRRISDLTNQVEGRAWTNMTTMGVCKFLIEDVICRYGCVGKIVADRGEIDAEETKELFNWLDVKLSLTTAYNPKANGKIEVAPLHAVGG